MDYDEDPPTIMRLTGVKYADYVSIEDVFSKRLLEEAAANPGAVPPVYDRIPKKFESMSLWPKEVTVRCWCCDRLFSSRPVFIPLEITGNERAPHMKPMGVFCSFSCATLHIDIEFSGADRERFMRNLLHLFFIFTGKRLLLIKPAPRKTEKIPYGGDMTEADWKKLHDSTNPEIAPCMLGEGAINRLVAPDMARAGARHPGDSGRTTWDVCDESGEPDPARAASGAAVRSLQLEDLKC